MHRLDVMYSLRYYWKNDIDGIIRHAEYMRRDKRMVMHRVTQVMDIFELGRLIGRDNEENSIMALRYLHCLRRNCLPEDKREGNCGGCGECENPKECYGEYLYFKDRFQVISHLTVAPDIWLRKLPVMMVDKNQDGTYFIHGSLTVKNPDFSDLFYDVIEGRSPERERCILIVQVEELLDSAWDMEKAVCGFQVLADSVEVFDGYEGIQLFGEALKEARDSGKCTVDGEFY